MLSPGGPSVTACTSSSPPTNAPFHDAPRPPNGSSRSPRERGLLMPDLERLDLLGEPLPPSRRRRRRGSRPARRWRRSSRRAARPRCRRRRSCRPARTARRASAATRPGGASSADRARRRRRCPARAGSARPPCRRGRAARRRRAPPRRPCGAARRLGRADQRAEVQLGQVVDPSPPSSTASGCPNRTPVDHRQVHRRGTRRPARAARRTAGTRCSAACRTRSPSCRCPASTSHSENSQMPQALRPSCSIMCRLSVSASCAATLPPLERPPTNATAPISGARTSTSESSAPPPDEQRGGQPRAAHQRVRDGQADRAALGRASWR